MIRTSGEHRISNFLLWEIAYSELVFTEVLWPTSDAATCNEAIDEFQRRAPLRRTQRMRPTG